MRMSIKDVPLPVRRLAAQHLESLRGTELMNGMEDARLPIRWCPSTVPTSTVSPPASSR